MERIDDEALGLCHASVLATIVAAGALFLWGVDAEGEVSEPTTQRIVRWDTGAVIWEGQAVTIKDAIHAAIAAGADLSWADLSWADLSRADLSWADLSRADLSRANLSGADLSGADLSRANLSGATGVDAARCTPLLMLLDQPGAIRAYKLVTADGVGPFNGGITYKVGKSYEVANASTDVSEACAVGIHVATLDWCLREWRSGYRVLVVEFTAADIAAIPTATDGKFRLHRCRVVDEKDITALVTQPQKATA